jgi:hypothetical protein
MQPVPSNAWLEQFDTANFDIVMGTGIVCLASESLGYTAVARTRLLSIREANRKIMRANRPVPSR